MGGEVCVWVGEVGGVGRYVCPRVCVLGWVGQWGGEVCVWMGEVGGVGRYVCPRGCVCVW